MEKSVLYIEDNLHNRRLVRKVLQSRGYEVAEAEDGLEHRPRIPPGRRDPRCRSRRVAHPRFPPSRRSCPGPYLYGIVCPEER